MDTSFSLRIDGNVRQWGGNNSPQGDRHNRRRQKLQALLESLKAGELDAARLAFTALVNFDPTASAKQKSALRALFLFVSTVKLIQGQVSELVADANGVLRGVGQ